MRSPWQTIEQEKAPFFVYYYLKIKYKQWKSKKGRREFRDSLHLARRERARRPCLTVTCVNIHNLRCRGAGCSNPHLACRPCSRQSETEAQCPLRWCDVPCPSSAAGAGYPERPSRRGLLGHTQICTRISLQPPDENMKERNPSLCMVPDMSYWGDHFKKDIYKYQIIIYIPEINITLFVDYTLKK